MHEGAPIENPKAERGYMGCALLDGNFVPELDASLLHDIRHQELIFQLKKMHAGGRPINPATVSAFLQSVGKLDEVGGIVYVNELADATASASDFPSYLTDVVEADLRRRLEAVGQATMLSARELTIPPLEAQAQAETDILSLRPKSTIVRKTNKDLIKEIIADMQEAHEHPGRIKGIATGFRVLDQILWGMQPGQLIVIGGRPGQGKSALMLQIAHNSAASGIPTGYLSLEMEAKQLLFRLQCAISGVFGEAARAGRLDQDEQSRFIAATHGLCRCPIHIEDGDLSNMAHIAAAGRRLMKDESIELLVVDYLQLIQGSNRKAGRYEAVSEVSAALKQLARQLGIPVIIGSQFNRDVEREERRPKLSDLRDSGSIEQDADIVMLIHNRDEDADDGKVPSELIVGKCRDGRQGTVNLVFNKPLTRFEEVPL